MKSTTLGGISGAVAGIASGFIFQTFGSQFSDTVIWGIILIIAASTIFLPPYFIKTIDSRKPYWKEHPRTAHIISLILFVPFGLFSLYVMISNGSINNGLFNLSTTLYAFLVTAFEGYKMVKNK